MFIVGVMFVYAEFGAVVSVQSVFGGYLLYLDKYC